MGYNSVLFLVNDALDVVDKDPAGWWRKARQALNFAVKEPTTFGFEGMANHFTAVSNAHADTTTLIAAGGNMAVPLGRFHTGVRGPGSNFHETDGQLSLIRQWAKEHGYSVIKDSAFVSRVADDIGNASDGLVGMQGATDWANRALEDLTDG